MGALLKRGIPPEYSKMWLLRTCKDLSHKGDSNGRDGKWYIPSVVMHAKGELFPEEQVKRGCQENVNNFEGQAVLWRENPPPV